MIVNNYNITFSDGKAPALNCKYSEVNREYILKPDVELNSDTYSAEFVIVKPDMTFTINSATIDNDGNIIITIPSQATVVKGVAQYLVRIYNDNTDVYSAYGEIWVDDNLLTDDVIESVAEVYGYNFPEDFALKDEAATLNDNVTATNSTWSSSKISEEISASLDIIDDNEVLYNKTWSSEKISYELGNVQPFHVYTNTEQPVGRWIDGKMLYERTITIQNVYITSPDHQMYYGVIDLSSYISNISNIFPNIDKSYIVMPDTTVRRLVWIDYQSTNAVIPYAMSPRSDVTLVLTVQYTKS